MDPRIAYLSTYPPRRCGIASFTHDLRGAAGLGGAVFALGPTDDDPPTQDPVDPPEVRAVIGSHTPEDYRRASAAIDGSGADVLSLQHEYGIYGGPDGSHLLALTRRLDLPIVSTFHTVLRQPSDGQRRVLQEIAGSSAASVVMSETAARRLVETYDVDAGRLHVIPHGVPDLSPVDPELRKPEFQLDARPTVLSFGLVGPGKGYEVAIEAMATVRETIPDALYVILGATHPDLLRREGERYRIELGNRVRGLGLDDNVRFVDRFVGRAELGRWLQACDVFVTPYPNLDQIVSGTLSYAVGAGRPAVSTPYAYARELLAGGRGVLVPAGTPEALGATLAELLADPERRATISRRAYAYGRGMIWRTVGAAYADVFRAVGRRPEPAHRRSRAAEPVGV